MGMIDADTMERLRERLAGNLQRPVELRLYRKPGTARLVLPASVGCGTCDATEELMRSLAAAAPDRISLTVIDVSAAGEPSIDVPTLTVAAPGEEPRITFQGLPSGYEFATLLDAVERVSSQTGDLAPETVEKLSALDQDVEVMVFVTPTCPYCPGAASMANRMALDSPKVRSVVVEANEFNELSDRFEVQGVPLTVVNRAGSFVGAMPESRFVDSVLQLAGVGAEGITQTGGEIG
jgi:glutaredoxin-like protein